MNGFTVLVVDDEPEVLNQLVELIEILGYSVLSANSAEQALVVLEEVPSIDLVLTDMNMPNGASGMVLCEWVAENKRDRTKVMLMTGHLNEFDEQKALSLGIVELLPKPFDLSLLQTCLENVILENLTATAS